MRLFILTDDKSRIEMEFVSRKAPFYSGRRRIYEGR